MDSDFQRKVELLCLLLALNSTSFKEIDNILLVLGRLFCGDMGVLRCSTFHSMSTFWGGDRRYVIH